MEFVRSRHRGKAEVYLPGASLKGVVRAHCERICRSLDGPARYDHDLARARNVGDEFVPPLADNPLVEAKEYQAYQRGGDDLRFSTGHYFNKLKSADTALIYRRSALTAQIFGSTALAGRVRFADAYPAGAVTIEERNGVAIDRVYGSVAEGPFNYETVVAGDFPTHIDFRNLTLAQLGLLGLALRDLAAGRAALGFGKSRGLGRVHLRFTSLELRYPACDLDGPALRLLNGKRAVPPGMLAGVGALCEQQDYLLDDEDQAPLPGGLAYAEDEERGLGVLLAAIGEEQVRALFTACMPAWKRRIGL
jgi:CRISPR/Cas system CSM-associated protein Csm3 (group 7 of RAMP superfamily)